eukprot:GEMP01011185.1.p1 GENE.GEMP01011185.1~~GEMP01011185.1.p1  ORF type:complete len:219 (+),score=42.02 GEMP01011185.1:58-714(+)
MEGGDWLTTVCRFIPAHNRIYLTSVNSDFRGAVLDNPFFQQDINKARAAVILKDCFSALHEASLQQKAEAFVERLRERQAQRLFRELHQRAELRRLRTLRYVSAFQMGRRRRLLQAGLKQWAAPRMRQKLLMIAVQSLKQNTLKNTVAASSSWLLAGEQRGRNSRQFRCTNLLTHVDSAALKQAAASSSGRRHSWSVGSVAVWSRVLQNKEPLQDASE